MTTLKPATQEIAQGVYLRHDGEEARLNSAGDIVQMLAPSPKQVLTFSHALRAWLCSYMGLWVVCSAGMAREAFDSGCVVLDAV